MQRRNSFDELFRTPPTLTKLSHNNTRIAQNCAGTKLVSYSTRSLYSNCIHCGMRIMRLVNLLLHFLYVSSQKSMACICTISMQKRSRTPITSLVRRQLVCVAHTLQWCHFCKARFEMHNWHLSPKRVTCSKTIPGNFDIFLIAKWKSKKRNLTVLIKQNRRVSKNN